MGESRKFPGFVVVGALAVVVMALVALSVSFQRSLQMATAEQFNRQQQLLAQSQAASIQHYLDDVGGKVSGVARALARLQGGRAAELEQLGILVFNDTHLLRKRIEFFDRDGGRLFANAGALPAGPDAPALVAGLRRLCRPGDRAPQAGTGRVSVAADSCSDGELVDLLAEADTRRITIAAPACDGGTLVGAVAVSLDIQELATALLGPREPGGRHYSWIIDGRGNLLFHPEKPEMTGRNLYRADASCFGCHKTFELEKRIVEGGGNDSGRYVAPTGEDKIVSYSTASVGAARWIIAVSAPYSEVTKATRRWMNIYSLIVILGFLTTSGVAAGLILVDRKRKQAEERARREATQEMMQAEKLGALERLTTGIAAAIGNPLASTFSFVDVLMAMEKDELKRETLETIRLHMDQISEILQQLSRFSQRPSVEPAPCKVNGVVDGALALIQYDQKVQDITFVRNLASGLPEIRTDKAALSQVVVKVILRAADTMPEGGTLTVSSRLEQGRIVLEFRDTGGGIPPEEIRQISDPPPLDRQQVEETGLAISYAIIRRLGGDLRAESEPGQGSRFLISLPVGGAGTAA